MAGKPELKHLTLNSLQPREFEKRQDIGSVEIYDCTEIPERCFSECANLSEIIVHAELKKVHSNAFYKCRKLVNFSSPNASDDLSIESEAFFGCSYLEHFDCFCKTVSIGSYAFSGCIRLKRIDLGPHLKHLAKSAFYLAKRHVITVEDGDYYYMKNGFVIENTVIRDGDGDGYTRLAARAIYLTQEAVDVVIPDGIQFVSDMLFKDSFIQGSKIRSITIPSELESLEDPACDSLADNHTKEAIGSDPFERLIYLEKFKVSSNDRPSYMISSDGVLYSNNGRILLRVPKRREGVFEIPEGVTGIGRYAFSGTRVTKVILPTTLEEIGYGAFRSGPNHVEVSENVRFTKKDGLLYMSHSDRKGVIFCDEDVKMCKIEKNTTYIREYAFQNCNLQYIRLRDSIQQIGPYAFENCRSLSGVFLPPRVRKIESGLFKGCSKLAILRFPDNVSSIADRILEGCTQHIHIFFPNNNILISEDMYHGTNCSITAYFDEFDPTLKNDALFSYNGIQSQYSYSDFDATRR